MSMSDFAELTPDDQVATLEPLLPGIVAEYGLELVGHELLNHAFNTTFRLDFADGSKRALRININSTRTPANLAAEIAWVRSIDVVKVPRPVAKTDGTYSGSVWHSATGHNLLFVLYEWLDGVELETEITDENLFAAGAAMAKLHQQSANWQWPAGTELPLLNDAMWGLPSFFNAENPNLDEEHLALITPALEAAQALCDSQFAKHSPQVIHADMHGWNLMWDEATKQLAVFDFDDCAVGTPLQDLATALYYFEPKQCERWCEGYRSVMELPEYTEREWHTLLIQRRLILLNSIFDTTDHEARALLPSYLIETTRRLREFLNQPAPLPKTLAQFANTDARITRLPVKLSKKVELAHWLLEQVRPDWPYSEPELNAVFERYVDDFALMRRLLVEEGLLTRDPYGFEYRRIVNED